MSLSGILSGVRPLLCLPADFVSVGQLFQTVQERNVKRKRPHMGGWQEGMAEGGGGG